MKPMGFSLIQCLHDLPLAFVDVETTGASAQFGHRIIELGIVRIESGRKVAEYTQLIDPQRRITAGVTALTGISQQMVQGQPRFADQLPAALGLLQGAVVLGHNVRFDLSFLRKEFRRCGRDITEALSDAPVLDPVRIARRRFGRGGNALQRLAPRLGIYPSVAHRALPDAQTTALVFEELMKPVGGWSICLCDAMREQGGPMGLLPKNPRESPLPLELEEALEQRKPVMLEYLDSRQVRTHRVIEPAHVRRRNGQLMLIAQCHLRGKRRTFMLDRIVQLTRLEAHPTSQIRVESGNGQATIIPQAEPPRPPVASDTGAGAPAAIDPGEIPQPAACPGLPDPVRIS